MIFLLDTSCFGEGSNTFCLIELADLVLKGRHRLFVQDDAHVDYRDWANRLQKELSEIWNFSLDLSMELEALEPAKHTILVCEVTHPNYTSSPPILDVKEASRLAKQPYRVFVENDDADRDFLLTFSSNEQKVKINELEKENLIRFEHSGGIGELKKKVEKFARKHPLNHTICASVFDSDAPKPGGASTQAVAVKNLCAAHFISGFMLERRAIENYLMRSWIETWVNDRPNRESRQQFIRLFRCFCQLSAEQRKHFHMKKGLSADRTGVSDGSIDLYDDVEEALLKRLENGFGSDVGSDLYSQPWVQSSQPSEDPEAWDEVNRVVRDIMVLCR